MKNTINNTTNDIILLDGFPRTQRQAQIFKFNIDKVIHIQVEDSEIRSRITDRWIHLPSGRTYSLKWNPPRKCLLDDVTGEPLQQRLDDKDKVYIDKRLEGYHSHILDIRHYFGDCIMMEVEGKDSKSIYEKLKEKLNMPSMSMKKDEEKILEL